MQWPWLCVRFTSLGSESVRSLLYCCPVSMSAACTRRALLSRTTNTHGSSTAYRRLMQSTVVKPNSNWPSHWKGIAFSCFRLPWWAPEFPKKVVRGNEVPSFSISLTLPPIEVSPQEAVSLWYERWGTASSRSSDLLFISGVRLAPNKGFPLPATYCHR